VPLAASSWAPQGSPRSKSLVKGYSALRYVEVLLVEKEIVTGLTYVVGYLGMIIGFFFAREVYLKVREKLRG